jgi:hypothetical protein
MRDMGATAVELHPKVEAAHNNGAARCRCQVKTAKPEPDTRTPQELDPKKEQADNNWGVALWAQR